MHPPLHPELVVCCVQMCLVRLQQHLHLGNLRLILGAGNKWEVCDIGSKPVEGLTQPFT
jgi:hypothetical protein